MLYIGEAYVHLPNHKKKHKLTSCPCTKEKWRHDEHVPVVWKSLYQQSQHLDDMRESDTIFSTNHVTWIVAMKQNKIASLTHVMLCYEFLSRIVSSALRVNCCQWGSCVGGPSAFNSPFGHGSRLHNIRPLDNNPL